MSNSFGECFKFTTFGESHGKAIGCTIDGYPAGVKIDLDFIQSELDKRKPGGKYATKRKEGDEVKLLSGVFEGVSTGTPIMAIIFNSNQKSRDYDNVKDLFRPSHADFTYFHKYGVRDYRGGGRSSARETASRVIAGAFAKLILRNLSIEVQSGVYGVGQILAKTLDFEFANSSEIYSLCKENEDTQKELITTTRHSHDSIGSSTIVRVKNMPIGLGEPVYNKLDAALASALMSINGVKAVEIGNGIESSTITGIQNVDEIRSDGFKSNNSGGILGGISNGDDLIVKVHFKPTPSIFHNLETVNIHNEEVDFKLKGRHDPCIGIRGSIVANSMVSVVLLDMMLLNMNRKLSSINKFYN